MPWEAEQLNTGPCQNVPICRVAEQSRRQEGAGTPTRWEWKVIIQRGNNWDDPRHKTCDNIYLIAVSFPFFFWWEKDFVRRIGSAGRPDACRSLYSSRMYTLFITLTMLICCIWYEEGYCCCTTVNIVACSLSECVSHNTNHKGFYFVVCIVWHTHASICYIF